MEIQKRHLRPEAPGDKRSGRIYLAVNSQSTKIASDNSAAKEAERDKNRSFTVKVHASHSSQKIAAVCVPQGSVPRPVLFNIYLADIPTFPHNSIAMYADDTSFYSASFSPIVAGQKLQNQLPLATSSQQSRGASNTKTAAIGSRTKISQDFNLDFAGENSATQLQNVRTHHLEYEEIYANCNHHAIEIEKAFDKVWHDGLIYQMSLHRTPATLTNPVQHHLRDRAFSVKIEEDISTDSTTQAVPQSAVLGSLLFNIYTFDVPQSKTCHITTATGK
ncbi:hypothetical protein Trydic_g17563 [Trypoxylus dichotomus]